VIEYKRDENDQPVLSRLDEDSLGRIALATGGKYFRATDRESEVEEIAGLIADMESKELASKLFTRYEERFYWPLAVAIAILIAETVIPRRRREKKVPLVQSAFAKGYGGPAEAWPSKRYRSGGGVEPSRGSVR
jgi:Ca-activated chloride channel family protein